MSKFKILLILFVIINIVSIINGGVVKKKKKACLTKTCVKEATNILNIIDESISPCDDFYQFSCGKWIENKELPEHKPIINRYTELQDQLNIKIKNLILKLDPSTESPEFVKNIKRYYDSCVNTTRIEELGDRPLQRLLKRVRVSPSVLQANRKHLDWTDTYVKLRKLGLIPSVLFTLSVKPNPTNNSLRILSIDQPSFGMGGRDSVLKGVDDPSVKAYKNLILQSALKMGDSGSDTLNKTVNDIFNFETLMANNSMANELRLNMTAIYSKMTIKDLSKIAPNISWLTIIRSHLSENITEEEEIALYDTQYIKSLNDIAISYTDQFLINYMLWRVVNSKMSDLNERWFKLKEKYDFAVLGTRNKEARWEMCIANTNKLFGIALSHIYAKKFFTIDNKEESSKLFANVVKDFRNSLESNTWITNNTLTEALDKIDKMKLMIGYPGELMNATKIDEYYKNLELNSSDYFGNNLKLDKFFNDITFNQLREPVDPYDWRELSSVAVINAHYNSGKNLVNMPAGLFQGVLFNKNRPNYLNYGSIAHIFGREIIHGFDNSGKQYDANGELRKWWDNTTNELYAQKANCFIDQYSNYTIEGNGQKLNAIHTQVENIADNGGILASYKTYLKFYDQNTTESPLPALDYTPQQLFWISAGGLYCSKSSNEYLKTKMLIDSYSPSKPRVNFMVSNSPEFSEAFNCALGSPMNPVKKCNIW